MAVVVLLCFSVVSGLEPSARAQQPNEQHEKELLAKHRTPRATFRTFLRAVSVAREAPRHIDDAVSCLDLSGLKPPPTNPGLIAFRLEAILRVKEVDTELIPDSPDGDVYVLPDPQKDRIALQRGLDEHWLFDQETVAAIPKMWPAAQKRLLEMNREAASLNISPDFATPRATFRTFMTAYYRRDTERVLKCMNLDDIPPVARDEVGEQLANKLRQIMYRYQTVIFQEVPDTNFSDPYTWLSHPSGVIELVRLASGSRKGEWVFSRETVRSIDHLYDAYEDQPYLPEQTESAAHLPTPWHATELWVRNWMPTWLKAPILGQATQGQPVQPVQQVQEHHAPRQTNLHLALYELLGYIILLALGYGVSWVATWLLAAGVRWFLRWRGWEVPPELVLKRLRPTGRFLGVLLLRWGVLVLGGSEVLLVGILTVLNPLLWLLGTWALFRLIDLAGDLVEAHLVAGKRGVEIAQMLWPVGSLALKITLFLITLFHLMYIFAWDVSTVLAGLGIGGVAFALGAQDSLKNLFGSFTLIADRPFVVGENVKIGDRDIGVVEVVGLRSTRIRTADDTLLIVPNSNLTTMNITNYGRRRYRRFHTQIGVVYNTPMERLIAFRDGIREIILNEKRTRKNQFEVAISELGDSAIKISVNVFFEATDARQESEARESLILAILGLADRLHIDLAFPTQTVHLVPPAEPSDGHPSHRASPAVAEADAG